MAEIKIKKGKDLALKGAAVRKVEMVPGPEQVLLYPDDFRGLRLRLLVKPDDLVQVGTPVIEDKKNPAIKIVAPVSGRVKAVHRGEKRKLLSVEIAADGKNNVRAEEKYLPQQIDALTRQQAVSHLLSCGSWVFLRQRPFSTVADPQVVPKTIIVQGLKTEPLAPDLDFIMEGQENVFQQGLNILTKLTDGEVHLCCAREVTSSAFRRPENVKVHSVSGPHPAGNVSTLIHYLDPIRRGDVVWYCTAQDVVNIAQSFLTGAFAPERIIAVTGEGADKRVYKRTIIGAPLKSLLQGATGEAWRYLSGDILSGTDVGEAGSVCFYDSQITVIRQGTYRELLGWIRPGINKYSLSRTFLSALLGKNRPEPSLDSDQHGGVRAIVLNHVYDAYVPLDLMTYFLIRAITAGDLDDCERLGILECDEEDFALCSFVCPSKVNVGAVIRQGLEMIREEG